MAADVAAGVAAAVIDRDTITDDATLGVTASVESSSDALPRRVLLGTLLTLTLLLLLLGALCCCYVRLKNTRPERRGRQRVRTTDDDDDDAHGDDDRDESASESDDASDGSGGYRGGRGGGGGGGRKARPADGSLVGERVELRGLQDMPELNGRVGVPTSFSPEQGRYTVTVPGCVTAFALRPANLVRCA